MPVVKGRLQCWNGHDLGSADDPYRDPDCVECEKDRREDGNEKAVIVVRGKGGELDRATLEIDSHEGGDFTGAVIEFLRSQVLQPGDSITLEDCR